VKEKLRPLVQIKPIVIAVLLISWNISFAQKWDYKVIVTKGENININTGKQLKTGDKLDRFDTVSVSENGYLGLISKSGRTKEIKGPKKQRLRHFDLIEPDSCRSFWLENNWQPSNNELRLSINGSTKVFPSKVRVMHQANVVYDSVQMIFLGRCGQRLFSQSTQEDDFIIDFSTLFLDNEHFKQAAILLVGYQKQQIDSSNIGFLEMATQEDIGFVNYYLRRASNSEDSATIFRKNSFFFNAAYFID